MELIVQEKKVYLTEKVKKGKTDLNVIEILMWVQYGDSYSDNHSKNNTRSYKEEIICIYTRNNIGKLKYKQFFKRKKRYDG